MNDVMEIGWRILEGGDTKDVFDWDELLIELGYWYDSLVEEDHGDPFSDWNTMPTLGLDTVEEGDLDELNWFIEEYEEELAEFLGFSEHGYCSPAMVAGFYMYVDEI